MIKLQQTIIEKLIKDPDFERIEEFIVDFFDNDTSINSVDSKLPSEVVHAQVIAKQDIDSKIKELISYFRSCRGKEIKNNKISYK